MEANNMAAMREALENSNGLLEELAVIGEWGESAREQIAENNAALSAPPRNCDRLKTGKEAKYRFLQIAELPEGNGDADMREWYRKLIAWLFSPVGEGTVS